MVRKKEENDLMELNTKKDLGSDSFDQIDEIDKTYDTISKELLQSKPYVFFKHFKEFSNMTEEEFERLKVTFIDKELKRVVYLENEADAIALVSVFKNKAFHVEFQTKPDETFIFRILDYMVAAIRKLKCSEVESLVFNIRKSSKHLIKESQSWGGLNIDFTVRNFWEMNFKDIVNNKEYQLLPFTPFLDCGDMKKEDAIMEANEIIKGNVRDKQVNNDLRIFLAFFAEKDYHILAEKLFSLLFNSEKMSFDIIPESVRVPFEKKYFAEGKAEGKAEDCVNLIEQDIAKSIEEAMGILRVDTDERDYVRILVNNLLTKH